MGPEPETKKERQKMEKSTLFENLLNAPKKTRNGTIANFATVMGVDGGTVYTLLANYHDSQRVRGDDEMILDLTFISAGNFCAADAPRILDAAGIRSIRLDGVNGFTLELLGVFQAAGWQISTITVTRFGGDKDRALRLSRA